MGLQVMRLKFVELRLLSVLPLLVFDLVGCEEVVGLVF